MSHRFSAFVGLATIVVLLPVPGYIAKQVQQVQKTRLTKSDARVQSITEGKQAFDSACYAQFRLM